MKKGDLVQHVDDDGIVVYEIITDISLAATDFELVVDIRAVYTRNGPVDRAPIATNIAIECLYPANEMLVMALAMGGQGPHASHGTRRPQSAH
jgi:hypothetical protein